MPVTDCFGFSRRSPPRLCAQMKTRVQRLEALLEAAQQAQPAGAKPQGAQVAAQAPRPWWRSAAPPGPVEATANQK